MRTFISSLSFLVALAPFVRAVPPAPAGQPKTDAAKPAYRIILVDRSDSFRQLEDNIQALLSHQVQLADLSGDLVQIAVIFFGGNNEVTVVGDMNRMPTAAYKTLHQHLLTNWPKLSGTTPLDTAMQEALRIVKALPAKADVSVLLFTDGQPDSGVLRPDAFPDVKAALDKQVKGLHEKYRAFGPATTQKMVDRYMKAAGTPETEEFKQLYEKIQLPAEFRKTLEHAAVLKKAGARFVTIDYAGGIPELKQIHEAAGGKPEDLVLATPPSTAITKLHALGLTAFPGVVVQKPLASPADPKAFDKTVTASLDRLGERFVVTAVFDPPIPDFDRQARLEMRVGGNAIRFTTQNDDPNRLLSRDGAGKVVAAHLVLDAPPADGQVAFHYHSPESTFAVPAVTVYVHFRLPGDVAPAFRPRHAAPDTQAPFRVSTTQPATWVLELRSASQPKPFPLKSAEPVLRNVQSGTELRLSVTPDPQAPHVFVTDASRLPRGTYDVDLHLVLDSGVELHLKLPRHVESQEAEECATLEITQAAGAQVQHASHKRGHVCFGEVGDAVTTATVVVFLRTQGIPYPLEVGLSVDGLVDAQQTAPKAPWVQVKPAKLTLQPGRADRVFLTLKLPELVEEQLTDGLFQGTLNLVRADFGETLPVRRFKPISGVPEDEAPNLVTFTLRRPRLVVEAPRCFRNAIHARPDGRAVLRIANDVYQPFSRTTLIRLAHDSVLARQVSAFPSAAFVDPAGKEVPSVRLAAVEAGRLSQEVRPGDTGTWLFRLEIDDDPQLVEARGELTFSAPGLPPVHLPVEVVARRSLLGSTFRTVLVAVSVLSAAFGLVALIRWWGGRRFRPGVPFTITPERPLGDILQLAPTPRGDALLVADQPVRFRFEADAKTKPCGKDRPLPGVIDALKKGKSVLVEEDSPEEEEERWGIALLEYHEPAEVHGEVVEAPRQAKAAARQRRRMIRRVLLAAGCLALTLTLRSPGVLAAAQWLVDLVSH